MGFLRQEYWSGLPFAERRRGWKSRSIFRRWLQGRRGDGEVKARLGDGNPTLKGVGADLGRQIRRGIRT